MEKHFEREVLIDYKVENRERLNSIGIVLNSAKKRSKIHDEFKSALKDEGILVEHVPQVSIIVKPYDGRAKINDARAYIYESKKCHSQEMLVEGNSHIVQISIGCKNSSGGWHNGETDFPAKVYLGPATPKEVVVWLVEDIRLDILMFYFFSLDELYSNSDERRAFSRTKVKFVKDMNLQSYIGTIEDPEYVSMASFFRNGKTYDWHGYIKTWKAMVDSIKQAHASYDTPAGIEMFKVHPKYKQISTRRLKILLEGLKTEKYYLIRTERRPREKKIQKEIMSRFGLEKWKIGKLKIVPSNTRYTWERMLPYISMFPFHWEERLR